jgi:folate-binding protein YgfZ
MTPRRDRVTVEGPDTWPFLQSLLSQDLDGIADGERRPTLLLTPRGKVESVAGVTRRGDAAVLDTDPGWGEELAAALGRYRIRTKVDIVVEAAPAADDATVAAEEAERIAAGRPGLGTELDDTVIPQEAFLEHDAVSFTKGCFVGQELVCRIDTRGHVNRYLRHVVPEDAAAVLAPGATVVVDGAAVGTITSSAPGRAFAYVRHEVEPPHPATVDGAPVTVTSLES